MPLAVVHLMVTCGPEQLAVNVYSCSPPSSMFIVSSRIVVVAPFEATHTTSISYVSLAFTYFLAFMLPTAASMLKVTYQGGEDRVFGPSKLAKLFVLRTSMLVIGPLECIGELPLIVRVSAGPVHASCRCRRCAGGGEEGGTL